MRLIALVFCGSLVAASPAATAVKPLVQVDHLMVEHIANPLGIDNPAPGLSWRLDSARRGVRQTAYQVQVATSARLLESGKPDVWDSGKVVSSNSVAARYSGKALASRGAYYWRVRVWDESGAPSKFSFPARFEMAFLQPTDWLGHWVGANYTGGNGYHSQLGESVDTAKWVQIDLGAPKEFCSVVLYPARPYNWSSDVPGFGFPMRYRIEASDEPEFRSSRVIADMTREDQPSPLTKPVTLPVGDQTARYIRVVATKLDSPQGRAPLLALAEVEVLYSDGSNIAANASVTALDSIEEAGWSVSKLTDGERVSREPGSGTPMLRREFTLDKPIRQARAYVSGLGYYELWVNGKRVGDRVLDPPRTTHEKRVYYSAYDITKLLKRGANCAGAILGQGWWWAGPLRLLCQIEVTFADGTSALVATDPSWESSQSPITGCYIYHGETYDARLEQPGWNEPGFDASSWRPAVVMDVQTPLTVETIQPMKVTETIKPKSVTSPKPGVWVFDFGQNIAGWSRLHVSGKAGTAITMRHAELLYPDGTINPETLTLATQADTYILNGQGIETYEPRFIYHGFRYVQMEGYPGTPTLDSLEGRVVHTAFDRRGTFSCSNDLLNRVYDACLWTQRDNFHSIPTDCPQRNERHGWLNDARVSSYAMLYSFDMPPAYAKFLRDIQDAQGPNCRVPDMVPDVSMYNPPDSPWNKPDPMWADGYPLILWYTYLHTGDKLLLDRHYENIKRYVEMLRSEAGDACILTHNNYGDWIGTAETPKDLISTGAFLIAADALMRMAGELGNAEDAKTYSDLRSKIADAFNARFFDAKTSEYGNGSQFSNALPLCYGIVPEGHKQAVFADLVKDIESRKGHLSTGIVGTPVLMDVLVKEGRADLAYTIATQEDFPGWGYMLANGATTIWELWEHKTGKGMNSHNHPALAFISGWYYETLSGLALDPAHAGWEHFIVKPHVVGDLKWAKGKVETIRGIVESDWKLTSNGLTLAATIPANSTATVYIPTLGRKRFEISESGKPVWRGGVFAKTDGVSSGETAGDWIAFEVGSGVYSFLLAGQ